MVEIAATIAFLSVSVHHTPVAEDELRSRWAASEISYPALNFQRESTVRVVAEWNAPAAYPESPKA
jgi:hypothetical protein